MILLWVVLGVLGTPKIWKWLNIRRFNNRQGRSGAFLAGALWVFGYWWFLGVVIQLLVDVIDN